MIACNFPICNLSLEQMCGNRNEEELCVNFMDLFFHLSPCDPPFMVAGLLNLPPNPNIAFFNVFSIASLCEHPSLYQLQLLFALSPLNYTLFYCLLYCVPLTTTAHR
ncbi:Hypothetical protein, putative [Bodo saltans]|uniref:Uncharacterized protein n=1 Tax=Bodo saltans TaxID=75058 RepID=A0A0S4JBL6_BODSA|nr:Hypothetical protein, putative [Bodo saltans]|eukprot:CUG87488.1 Hypothetical protein, putative [Bodo saltans]